MPKRHPYFYPCKNDFKLVFRSPTDTGATRKLATPSPAQMLTNIQNFERKWVHCDCNGWKVLPEGALRQLTALKAHISKGCLSSIDPGFGTNRNEVLHRLVNPRFTNKSKIGLPLGLALLTILLYWHNVSIEEKITGKPPYPIEMKKCTPGSHEYIFGVERKCDIPEVSWICSDLQLKNMHT